MSRSHVAPPRASARLKRPAAATETLLVRIIAILLVLALLALGAVRYHRKRENEARLGAIASEVAGRKVGIRCQIFLAHLVDISPFKGSVQFGSDGRPADDAKLTYDTCRALERFRRSRTHPELECLLAGDPRNLDPHGECGRSVEKTAKAIEILAHEAYHLAGERGEAAAQCFGIQAIPFVAARLGAREDEARVLSLSAVARLPEMPPEYQSGECRPGGRLDLHPETAAWP